MNYGTQHFSRLTVELRERRFHNFKMRILRLESKVKYQMLNEVYQICLLCLLVTLDLVGEFVDFVNAPK